MTSNIPRPGTIVSNENTIFFKNKDPQSGLQYINGNQRVFGKELSIYTNNVEPNFKPYNGQIYSARTSVSKFQVVSQPEQKMELFQPMSLENIKLGKASPYIQKMIIEDHQEFSRRHQQQNSIIENTNIEQIDIQNMNNPQMVSIYACDIFNYLRYTEEKHVASLGYMPRVQTDINEKMRAILVDWLVDVHLKFRLVPETLYLTMNLIDRYLEKTSINRQKLQLVGVSAMLIACKYEEIYSPEIKDFVYVTDKAYTIEEVLEMEGKILETVSFNLTTTSSHRFLERYSQIAANDEKTYMMARYILELALIDYRMLKFLPSLLASGAHYLACKIYKKDAWNDILCRNCKYNESQVRLCAKELCVLLKNAEKSSLQAVRRKFSQIKFLEVARIQFEKLQ